MRSSYSWLQSEFHMAIPPWISAVARGSRTQISELCVPTSRLRFAAVVGPVILGGGSLLIDDIDGSPLTRERTRANLEEPRL